MNATATTKTNGSTVGNERLSRLGLLQEPAGYVDGQNLYEYVRSCPTSLVDLYGEAAATQPTTRPIATDSEQDYHDKYSRRVNCASWAFNAKNTIGTNFADQLDTSAGHLNKMLGATDAVKQTKAQADKMLSSNEFGIEGRTCSVSTLLA
jgi:hypothetical protein